MSKSRITARGIKIVFDRMFDCFISILLFFSLIPASLKIIPFYVVHLINFVEFLKV